MDRCLNLKYLQVIAEPGRFYVSSAYTLACNIHSIRNVSSISSTGEVVDRRMYYINDGVYGSFNCILYDHQVVVPKTLKEYDTPLYMSSIWGPTCDGLDQVVEQILLPDMKEGDWLVFEDMGAYTLPVASPFNGFPIPRVHVVAHKNILWVTNKNTNLNTSILIVWLFFRMLFKDLMPLTDEHFDMGTIPYLNCNCLMKVGVDFTFNPMSNWLYDNGLYNLDLPTTLHSFTRDHLFFVPIFSILLNFKICICNILEDIVFEILLFVYKILEMYLLNVNINLGFKPRIFNVICTWS